MKAVYQSSEMEIQCTPMELVRRIVHSKLCDDTYFAYEKGAHWYVGIGNISEVTVNVSGQVTLTENGTSRVIEGSDPLNALDQALKAVNAQGWTAFGTSKFELSYLLYGLDVSNMAPETVVLRLVVPEICFEVSNSSAVLKLASNQEQELRNYEAFIGELDHHSYNLYAMNSDEELLQIDVSVNEGYSDSVSEAIKCIKNGDFLKVILSRRVFLPQRIDVAASFFEGRLKNNPARAFLLNCDGLTAAGFSPEIVAEITPEGRVVTQPLAGTRSTGQDLKQEEALKKELLSDPKELAEHAMSVKLSVEELLQCCEQSSVMVEEYMNVLKRGSVQHLASRVAGKLADGKNAWEAFGTLFPAVTASGIDKRNSIDFIRRNEPHPRGLYSGAVMMVQDNGAIDAALVLRSMFQDANNSWLQAGAGVVENSRPARELEETIEKASSVSKFLRPLTSQDAQQ